MDRQAILSILRRHAQKLSRLARRIIISYKADDIHIFRVEAKKLRAFLRLISPACGQLRLPKRLRTFYKESGVLRNLQLQRESWLKLSTATQDKQLQAVVSRLDEEMMLARHRLAALVPKRGRAFGDLVARLEMDLPARLNQAHRHRFLAAEMQVLHPANIPQDPDDGQLHGLRKSMKDLLYTWDYLGGRGRKQAGALLGGRKKIKSAAQLLGDYLDVRLRLESLAGYAVGARALLEKTRDAWTGDKTSFRREIDQAIGRKLHFGSATGNDPLQAAPLPAPLNPLIAGNTSALSNELHLD